MTNLEGLETSYNRKIEQKILKELDAIDCAQEIYLHEKRQFKMEQEELSRDLKIKIIENIAHIKTLSGEKKEKIKKITIHSEAVLEELKENYRLDSKEIKQQKILVLDKIVVNYNRIHREYLEAIEKGLPQATEKNAEFENAYKGYIVIETKTLEENCNAQLANVLNTFNKAKEDLDFDYQTKVAAILEEYEFTSERKVLTEQLEKCNDSLKRSELKKKISMLSRVKLEKKERELENKKLKEELLELKKARIAKEIANKDSFEVAQQKYLKEKQMRSSQIKEYKAEAKKYYEGLSDEDKKMYKYYQSHVNQDYKARLKRKLDAKEKTIFKNLNPAYIYILPAVFGAVFFTLLPFIFMLIAAFFKLNLTNLEKSSFVGFNNFVQIFTRDTEFQKALGNTVIFSLSTIILLTVVTVSMAAWLAKNTRIHNLAQTMVFTPHIASLVAISIVWIAMLNPTGIINQVLSWFGIEGPGWLIQENTSLVSVAFVTVWKDIGYYVLIIISGLQAIPAYIYEAAKLDKSTRSKTFFKMTLPLLVPTLSFVLVTKFINSFKVFAPIEIMTNGGPMGSSMVLSYWIYKVGRLGYNYGQAMAGAIILTILIAGCTFINYRFFKKQVTY